MGKKKGKLSLPDETEKEFRCGNCGEEFNKEKQLIKHFKKHHPGDLLTLFSMVGTVGDKYVDNVIMELQDAASVNENRNKTLLDRNNTLSGQVTGYTLQIKQLRHENDLFRNAANAINNVQGMLATGIGALAPGSIPKG